jgi:hypothetical protein
MSTLTAQQEANKAADEKVLVKLLKGRRTLKQLGCTRHRLLKLLDAKLVKREGEVKNQAGARKAVTYELTAKGRKRAERCSA